MSLHCFDLLCDRKGIGILASEKFCSSNPLKFHFAGAGPILTWINSGKVGRLKKK